jgi:hypothetical protein
MVGVDDETISLYVAMRSRYGVKSQEPHLFRGEIAWSLPSGDPFTLLANCVMTAFSILGRYSERNLSKCVYLQKGDDALLNCRIELLPEPLRLARNVKFKVAFDTLPYHAGRFWLVDHFVADPIRVFCRHFARLADPNVTIAELHQSFVSRSVTLSHSDERIISCALLAMYTVGQVKMLMLRFVVSSRSLITTFLHPHVCTLQINVVCTTCLLTAHFVSHATF